MTYKDIWEELQRVVIDLRDNGAEDEVCTQRGICHFLAELMSALEKQIKTE